MDDFLALGLLPLGLALDGETGEISGEPEEVSAAADYKIVAVGPGGRDTAVINIRVVAAASDTGTPPVDTGGTTGTASVLARINVPTDTTEHPAVRKVVLEMVSSISADPVVRDTIVLEAFVLELSYPEPIQIQETYELKSLRSWAVFATALDATDATAYTATASINNLLVGEDRQIVLTFE